MHRRITRFSAGFTLVELSIVLVVLGLLAGGIMAGHNLLRAAELRKITTELEEWQTAVISFRARYDALPGDMADATRYWGVSAVSCASSRTAIAEGVCNGDGNGNIGGCTTEACGTFNLTETAFFWRHLQEAGLVEKRYTGLLAGTSAAAFAIGVNLPESRMGGGLGWAVTHIGRPDEDPFGGGSGPVTARGNLLVFGAGREAGADDVYPLAGSATLHPEEVIAIDRKMDDGRPSSGNLVVRRGDDQCMVEADGAMEYNVRPASGVIPACLLFFNKVF